MRTAGIKELKNKLSGYLSFVKQGEDVLVTERGRVIARIIQESPQKSSLRLSLQPLVIKGLITYPGHPLDKKIPEPVEVPGRSVSEMVIEDRR